MSRGFRDPASGTFSELRVLIVHNNEKNDESRVCPATLPNALFFQSHPFQLLIRHLPKLLGDTKGVGTTSTTRAYGSTLSGAARARSTTYRTFSTMTKPSRRSSQTAAAARSSIFLTLPPKTTSS